MGIDDRGRVHKLPGVYRNTAKIASLVYVGITRARNRLIIPHVNPTPLIDRLQRALRKD